MDEKFVKAAVRMGKELSEGMLSGYSKDYALGLSVALAIMWEVGNNRPVGSAHQITVEAVLNWVRDLQKIKEGHNARLVS